MAVYKQLIRAINKSEKVNKVVLLAMDRVYKENGEISENDEEKTRELAASLDGFNAYTGSKLALTRWVRRSAPEWAKDGIRLNAVAPGMTKTAMLEEALNSELFGKSLRNLEMPIGRYAEPEEVAECILFLLSEKASACCGAVLFADGGTDVTLRPDSF